MNFVGFAKMRSSAMNIRFLVIFCLWCHVQPTSGDGPKENGVKKIEEKKQKTPVICVWWNRLFCATGNRKRSDINDLAPETDLRADGERPDIHVDLQEGRAEERGRGRGRGGSQSDGYRDSREGDDDLRSELNRQLSDERQLVDIGDHRRGHSPRSAQLDSAISRLRSLLGTTDLDVDDRGEEAEEGKREERQQEEQEKQEEEEGTPKRGIIGQDRSNIINETQTLLSKILDDIERRPGSQ